MKRKLRPFALVILIVRTAGCGLLSVMCVYRAMFWIEQKSYVLGALSGLLAAVFGFLALSVVVIFFVLLYRSPTYNSRRLIAIRALVGTSVPLFAFFGDLSDMPMRGPERPVEMLREIFAQFTNWKVVLDLIVAAMGLAILRAAISMDQ
jgi:hypothetical protein